MTGQPEDPLDAGLLISEALEGAGVPHAIGGALAFGLWGIPRATLDIDLNVFVELDGLGEVASAFEGLGIEVDLESARADAEASGLFVLRWGLFRLDVFTPSIDFSWEAMRTRVSHEIEGRRAWFLSAEAIAVFKLLFFRAKDVVDLQRLIAVQGRGLDVDYVRSKIVGMMGEDDERVTRWDQLVSEHSDRGR